MKKFSNSFVALSLFLVSYHLSYSQIPDDINGRLWRLAKVWGLAKYYHPENCSVDWNNLMIETIDSVLVSTSNNSFNESILEMLQEAGNVSDPGYPLFITSDVNKNAIFTWKDDVLFTQEVRSFLNNIVDYFRPTPNCFVVENTQSDPDYVGYLSFTYDNLKSVPSFSYANEAHRLLALFYYWNIINYFNPNNDLMDQSWDTTLYQFIPLVRAAKNDTAFHILFLSLVTHINDTHGFTSSPLIQNHFGNYYPFIAIQHIEDQTVVTNVGDSIPDLEIGDIIKKINGIDIDILFDSLREFIPASNAAVLQRDLHQKVLTGPEHSMMDIEFENASGAIHTTSLIRNAPAQSYFEWVYTDPKPMWEITSCGYGYVNMGKLTTALTPIVYNAVKNTPAIIFDIRNYPNGTLWYLIPRLYQKPETWALLPVPDLTFPGWYSWYDNRNDAGVFSNQQPYSGKVIILANAETQSQAEYTVMGLQEHPNAFTIGSQTAGADGNVSNIVLPGGLNTYWSSLGIFYPDTTNAQRAGIRIDSVVKPTIEDIRKGRDRELLAALDCLTGIKEDPVVDASIHVYPNPVTDVLNISFDQQYTSPINVQVSNAIGQNVFNQKIHPNANHQIPVNVRYWDNGIYIIQIVTDDTIISTSKFVKQ